MNNSEPTFTEIHEALLGAMSIGSTRALLATIEAVAEAAGILEVHGIGVRQFYHAAAIPETERAIADIADSDPVFATAVKKQWDSLSGGQTSGHAFSEHSASRTRARDRR